MAPNDDQIRLLRYLAGARQNHAQGSAALIPTLHQRLDAALDGGLQAGKLHELFAARSGDVAGAAAIAGLLGRNQGGSPDSPLVWLREEQAARRLRLYAPGLAALGINPGRLLLAVLPDADAVLRAATDVLRCAGVGVAVIELWRNPRNLGLTATRRFQLAAEASGVTALLLRVEAEPSSSAAATRWSVRSIASHPLEANAPGRPAFELELLRQRGGGHGRWRLEWDRDAGRFHDLADAPLSGAVVPVPADRPLADDLPLRKAG